jgi:hypothetical protein
MSQSGHTLPLYFVKPLECLAQEPLGLLDADVVAQIQTEAIAVVVLALEG